jgi:hypothetical protein
MKPEQKKKLNEARAEPVQRKAVDRFNRRLINVRKALDGGGGRQRKLKGRVALGQLHRSLFESGEGDWFGRERVDGEEEVVRTNA